MGTGSLVFGIACVLIGERLLIANTVQRAVIGCFIGSIFYKAMLDLFALGGQDIAEYSSVITAVVLIFMIASVSDRKNSAGNF
jgi:ABC-type uncharacterized transport system permease subunit